MHRYVVRFSFAREHHNWQIRHRRSVLFTDESSFTESTTVMIDLLGCGDARETVAPTVPLSKLTSTMGARHGLGSYP